MVNRHISEENDSRETRHMSWDKRRWWTRGMLLEAPSLQLVGSILWMMTREAHHVAPADLAEVPGTAGNLHAMTVDTARDSASKLQKKGCRGVEQVKKKCT